MATKRMNCKFCDDIFRSVEDYVAHIEKCHGDMIPEGMSPWHFVYFLKTGKDHGSCVMCKKPTTFNEKTHKYNRFCSDPKCKEEYIKIFKSRMVGKYGKTTLLNDPEQQRKMLANRKISGVYKWSDHVAEKPYTGTYELSFLEFLDNTLQLDASDVFAPSPHTYWYEFDGKRHFYIPDFYIASLNLEVEVKENTNTHPSIAERDRYKEYAKDAVMKSNVKYINYIKIVEKHNEKMFKFLEQTKQNFANNITTNICMP